MPKIIYHDSDGVDKTFVLNREVLLVGRATECQIQTLDAMVSRRHARIFWDGGYWIEDLGSSNGVYVGSQKVDRAPFNAGDVVVCGSLVLRLEAEAGAGMDLAAPVAYQPPVAAAAPVPAPAPAPVVAAPAPEPAYVPPPAARPQTDLDRTPSPEGFARNVEPSQVIEVIQPPAAPQPRAFADAEPAPAPLPAPLPVAPPPAGLSPDALQAEVERSGRLAAEADREELRRQLDSAKIKAAADNRRQLDLEADLDKARAALAATPAVDPAQGAELEALRNKVSVLEGELKKADAVADELDAVRAKLTRVEGEMGSVAAAGSEQLAKAESERDELRRRVAQLAEEASQKQRTFDDEREQLEQKAQKLEESLRGQADVGTKANELSTERDALKAELEKAKSAETERDELRRRIAQLAEETSQKQRAFDDEREQMEQRAERADRKVSELEVALKSAGGQAEEVGQLRTRFATLEADLAQLTTERDETKKRAAQATEENATKLRAFETMRDELELKVANLESKLSAADGERTALQSRVNGLEKDIAQSGEAASETNQLRGDLNAAQAQLKNLEADRNAFKAAADDLRQKVADLEEAARQAQSTPGAAALETELENVKIELAVAKAAAGEREALQQKVSAYERELRQADATADELDRLKAEHGKTQKALADAQAAAGASAGGGAADAALQQKLDDASDKLAAGERQLSELRAQLAAAEKRASDAAAAKPAGGVDPAANDTLTSLSDALAELRLALRSANDESTMLTDPKQSVTIVIDSLTAATDHLENARSQVRTLSQLLGVG